MTYNRFPIYTSCVALYRLFSYEGELLYVGVSTRVWTRFEEHAADKYWWHEVSHHEIEWHAFRHLAEDAESVAIWQEKPKYNIARPLPHPGRRGRGQTLTLNESIRDWTAELEKL
jgi:predicted GIY-YIG superfamily endonuclease